jgi:hypothetical protein
MAIGAKRHSVVNGIGASAGKSYDMMNFKIRSVFIGQEWCAQ